MSDNDKSVTQLFDELRKLLPDGSQSKIIFDKDGKIIVRIPLEYTVVVDASGFFGTTPAGLVVYGHRRTKEPLDLLAIISVTTLNFNSVFGNAEISNTMETHFGKPQADVSGCISWAGVPGETLDTIAKADPDLTHAVSVVRKMNKRLEVSPTAKKTGVFVDAAVNLADLRKVPSPNSIVSMFNGICELAEAASIPELFLSCFIAKTEKPDDQADISYSFAGEIDYFPIIGETYLRDIKLKLDFPQGTTNVIATLKGSLIIGVFDSQNPWRATGSLTVDSLKGTADFMADLSPDKDQRQGMVSLGMVKLGNLRLRVLYTFAKATSSAPSPTPATCIATMAVDAQIGKFWIKGLVVFNGIRPSVLSIAAPNEAFSVNDLLTSVLDVEILANAPDLVFIDPRIAYSWNETTIILPETPGQPSTPESRTYEPGLTAKSRVDLAGILFDAVVRFQPSGADKGMFLSVALEKPLDWTILSLRDPKDSNRGPTISFDTRHNAQSLRISAGIRFIEFTSSDLEIVWRRSPLTGGWCLQCEVKVNSHIFWNGRTTIGIEYLRTRNRSKVRLYGLYLSEIIDAFDVQRFVDLVRLVRNRHGRCGGLPKPSLFKNVFTTQVEFSDHQPERVEGQPPRCAFDIDGGWDIVAKTDGKVVVSLRLPTIRIVINVPKTWSDLFKEVVSGIASSAERMVEELFNQDEREFERVISTLIKFEGICNLM